jgi:hypothetical protein
MEQSYNQILSDFNDSSGEKVFVPLSLLSLSPSLDLFRSLLSYLLLMLICILPFNTNRHGDSTGMCLLVQLTSR